MTCRKWFSANLKFGIGNRLIAWFQNPTKLTKTTTYMRNPISEAPLGVYIPCLRTSFWTHVPKQRVYSCPRLKVVCLIGSAQEISEVSVLNVLNFCFMFPFFSYFLFYYIWKYLCGFLRFWFVHYISYFVCPLRPWFKDDI